MEPIENAKTLRIYISSTDKFKHKPLYEVIVFAAKRYKLTGATVFRGIMGFGASSSISSTKFWEISEKLPLVVEIIDNSEKILQFVENIKPYFDKIPKGYLITIINSEVVYLKTGENQNI